MTDILIHRCTLRVVRRDGWSWGPDPKQFVDRLVRNFPSLLARALSDLMADEVDHDIAAPLRVEVPIRWDEFRSWETTSSGEWPGAGSVFSHTFAAKVEQAVREVISIDDSRTESKPIIDAKRIPTEAPAIEVRKKENVGPGSLVSILRRWHDQGLLRTHLSEAAPQELEAWHTLLLTLVPNSATSSAETALIAADLSAFVASQLRSDVPATRELLLMRRILLCVEAAERFQRSLVDSIVWQILDDLFPLDCAPSVALEHAENTAAAARPEPTPVFVPISRSAPTKAAPSWEVHISCALPFLLLSPLSSFHFFDAMFAALEAARVSEAGHLLAACLAYKILDPPDRGWLRSGASMASAAAFAGQKSGIDEADLIELARQLAPYTKMLDRINADFVLAGHTTGEPFVIARADVHNSSGYLLLEAQGLFPVQWTSEPSSLVATMSRVVNPIVLISEDASDPKLLDHLNHSGIVFIVSASPGREERWNRVPMSRSTPLWTNHARPESFDVLRSAGVLALVTEEATNFWEQVGKSRVSAIRATPGDLDHALTLMAGTALGTIAWKLWGERGRTSPQRLLERYSDLDAYVKFAEDALIVRLPLGRRHRELLDHGLLVPVEDAFWLGGRRVEFAGG